MQRAGGRERIVRRVEFAVPGSVIGKAYTAASCKEEIARTGAASRPLGTQCSAVPVEHRIVVDRVIGNTGVQDGIGIVAHSVRCIAAAGKSDVHESVGSKMPNVVLHGDVVHLASPATEDGQTADGLDESVM